MGRRGRKRSQSGGGALFVVRWPRSWHKADVTRGHLPRAIRIPAIASRVQSEIKKVGRQLVVHHGCLSFTYTSHVVLFHQDVMEMHGHTQIEAR